MRLALRALSGGTSMAVLAGLVLAAGATWVGVRYVHDRDSKAAACAAAARTREPLPWVTATPSPTAKAAPPPHPTGPVHRFMIVGDSITHGSSGDWTWRYRLYKHLVASGVNTDFVGPYNDLANIMTVALDDRDHAYLDPNFDQDHDAQYGQPFSEEAKVIGPKLRKYNPEYLVVLLGTNDLGWYKVDPGLVELSLKLFIANARLAKPDVRFVFGKVLPATLATTDKHYAAIAADFNQRLVTDAAALNTKTSPIAVADVGPSFDPAKYTWDGTHVNARGEIRVAAAFADTLATKFGIGTRYPRPFPDVPIGPQQPPRASIVSTGPTTADVSWTPSLGATGYWVWMKDDFSTKKWTKLPTQLTQQTNPWHVRNLAAGVTYRYRLQAAKGTDVGVVSNEIKLTVPGAKPLSACPSP